MFTALTKKPGDGAPLGFVISITFGHGSAMGRDLEADCDVDFEINFQHVKIFKSRLDFFLEPKMGFR